MFLLKQTVRYPPDAAAASLHTNLMCPRFSRSIIHSRWEFGAPCTWRHMHTCTHARRVSAVSTNGFKEARRNVKSSRKVCEGAAMHCGSLAQEMTKRWRGLTGGKSEPKDNREGGFNTQNRHECAQRCAHSAASAHTVYMNVGCMCTVTVTLMLDAALSRYKQIKEEQNQKFSVCSFTEESSQLQFTAVTMDSIGDSNLAKHSQKLLKQLRRHDPLCYWSRRSVCSVCSKQTIASPVNC